MVKGIVYALAACFIWALVYVIPQFIVGFTPLEISLGSYLFYGIISLFIYTKERIQGSSRYPLSIWSRALYFSLISTIVYYTCVVLAIRYATPAVCALILGIGPITISFYGNWKQKDGNFRYLLLPSILIFVGLIIINAPHIHDIESNVDHIIGLICSFLALIAWSWYVVANSIFLKNNPHVASDDWSTLMGVSTLLWVFICSTLLLLFFNESINLEKYYTAGPALTNFIVGCGALGLLCSWLGTFLWNKASFHLPVSIAGQLTIFETIFGLLFVYILIEGVPSRTECMGITLLLTSVALGVRLSNQAKYQTPDLNQAILLLDS